MDIKKTAKPVTDVVVGDEIVENDISHMVNGIEIDRFDMVIFRTTVLDNATSAFKKELSFRKDQWVMVTEW